MGAGRYLYPDQLRSTLADTVFDETMENVLLNTRWYFPDIVMLTSISATVILPELYSEVP